MIFLKMPATLFRSGGKLTRASDWLSAQMTFLKMRASFFTRETYSTVKLSKWENDFFRIASHPFRTRSSLERTTECMGRWLFSKCHLPFSFGKLTRLWSWVGGKMAFLKTLATLFVHETHPSVWLSGWENDFALNSSFLFRSGNSLDRKKLRKWKNDFFQNASYPFRSRNSLERASE